MRSKTVNDQHEPPEPPETKDNTEATKKFMLQSLENLEETADHLNRYRACLDKHRASLEAFQQCLERRFTQLEDGSTWSYFIYLAAGTTIGWTIATLIKWTVSP